MLMAALRTAVQVLQAPSARPALPETGGAALAVLSIDVVINPKLLESSTEMIVSWAARAHRSMHRQADIHGMPAPARAAG